MRREKKPHDSGFETTSSPKMPLRNNDSIKVLNGARNSSTRNPLKIDLNLVDNPGRN